MPSADQQLTRRQWDVLKYVRDAITNQGYPPTIREIAEALGTSLSTAHQHLKVLERKGFIHRTSDETGTLRRKSRDIEIRLPPGEWPNPINNELSSTQRRVLDALHQHAGYGPPPTLQEIAQELEFSSTSSVRLALKQLESKGLVQRERNTARSVRISDPPVDTRYWPSSAPAPPRESSSWSAVDVPVLDEDRVAAGVPMFAPSRTRQDADHFMSLPREIVGSGELFIVRVRGDSMRDAGILDGDFVIVRVRQMEEPIPAHGRIVLARVGDDEVTVKRLHFQGDEAWLKPENPDYEPIPGRGAAILGTVVAVLGLR